MCVYICIYVILWYDLYMLSCIWYICYIYYLYLYNLYSISYTCHIINMYIYISLYMWSYVAYDKSSRSQMFFKIDVFKNFAMFTTKDLCWSLFLIKLQVWRNSKRELQHCFPENIVKFLRTTIFKEHVYCFILDQLKQGV